MEYMAHLEKDRKLSKILVEALPELTLHKNIPIRLMASIMSQQLSTHVSRVIFRRFLELYNGKEPTVIKVLGTDPTVLRGIGLSNNKVSYILNVAEFCIENKITDKKLQQMDNATIIELLTEIKGVGKWTVEMLLMFSLGREDVFAVDDLGIQQAMIRLYKLDNTDKKALKEKMLQVSEKWSPYRTYACIHLWQWKDDK
ncbi:MAG: DNA-3-methyladenine glycosylase 2 family protein [Bacteroidota bacterium]